MTHRIKTPLVAFAGMALLGATLSAATLWTGNANDGDLFGTAGNWNSGLPGTGDATINNGDTVDLSTNYGTTINKVIVGGNSTLDASADFTSELLTIQNTGTVNLTGGAFTLPAIGVNNGAGLIIDNGGTLNISGGSHIINERAWIVGDFQVTGSAATISMNQIGGGGGNFDFLFDGGGVSTIAGDIGYSWLNIGDFTVSVDGTAVAGIAASYTLIDSHDAGAMMGAGAFTIAGLGAEGVGWTLDITDNPNTGTTRDTVVLNVIPEPGTYALIGGLLALSYVMVRRRS